MISDVATPATSYDDSNTEYDTEYLYRVRAGNDDGYGEWSDLDRMTANGPTSPRPGNPAHRQRQPAYNSARPTPAP